MRWPLTGDSAEHLVARSRHRDDLRSTTNELRDGRTPVLGLAMRSRQRFQRP